MTYQATQIRGTQKQPQPTQAFYIRKQIEKNLPDAQWQPFIEEVLKKRAGYNSCCKFVKRKI